MPLGRTVAQRALTPHTIAAVQNVIHDSLQSVLANRTGTLNQEFDDAILIKHVELYAYEWTRDLGETGRAASKQLAERSQASGLTANAATEIQVFCG